MDHMNTTDLSPGEARMLARLCLRLALIAIAILAGLLCAPAFAQEAPSAVSIEVAQGGGLVQPLRPVARARRKRGAVDTNFASAVIQSEGVLAVAQRYIGSGRFTPWARAWCADAVNAWLRMAGYRGTGDGRAISFARYGRPSGPQIGAIAVLRHHVGIVIGRSGRGVVLLSGNHSRRVGIGVYASHRIIAFREPAS